MKQTGHYNVLGISPLIQIRADPDVVEQYRFSARCNGRREMPYQKTNAVFELYIE